MKIIEKKQLHRTLLDFSKQKMTKNALNQSEEVMLLQ